MRLSICAILIFTLIVIVISEDDDNGLLLKNYKFEVLSNMKLNRIQIDAEPIDLNAPKTGVPVAEASTTVTPATTTTAQTTTTLKPSVKDSDENDEDS